MVFHKCRHGTDLHRVSIICRIFKESVVRVEELLRQKEEELSRRTTVIQAAKEAEARESIMNRTQGLTSIWVLVCSFRVSIGECQEQPWLFGVEANGIINLL